MINIPKQLWYVVAPSREDSLAYMTHYEDNAAFLKRKATGLHWASDRRWCYTKKEYVGTDTGDGVIIENTPTEDIYIGSSVSRWSTSNKLFRVKDPRGFTVEVPTDNIATLLHLTTVTHGVIQEPCVWAREGSNHILLPVNSEPYLKTLDQMDTLTNKLIKLADLKAGNIVKFFEDDTEYTYLGKAKITWRLKPYERPQRGYTGWKEPVAPKKCLAERTVKDSKWEPVFAFRRSWMTEGEIRYNTFSNPKVTEIIGSTTDIDILRSNIKVYTPQRIHNQEENNYCDFLIESVDWK